jgi:hypothetical protein
MFVWRGGWVGLVDGVGRSGLTTAGKRVIQFCRRFIPCTYQQCTRHQVFVSAAPHILTRIGVLWRAVTCCALQA